MHDWLDLAMKKASILIRPFIFQTREVNKVAGIEATHKSYKYKYMAPFNIKYSKRLASTDSVQNLERGLDF